MIRLLFALAILASLFCLPQSGEDAQAGLVGTRRVLLGGSHAVQPPSQPNGKILLVDGSSFILQTNGTSKICRAGGCL